MEKERYETKHRWHTLRYALAIFLLFITACTPTRMHRNQVVNEYNQILAIDEEYGEKMFTQVNLLNDLADKNTLEAYDQYLAEADKLFQQQKEYEQFANQTTAFLDKNAEILTKEGVDIEAQKAELNHAVAYMEERFKPIRENVKVLEKGLQWKVFYKS